MPLQRTRERCLDLTWPHTQGVNSSQLSSALGMATWGRERRSILDLLPGHQTCYYLPAEAGYFPDPFPGRATRVPVYLTCHSQLLVGGHTQVNEVGTGVHKHWNHLAASVPAGVNSVWALQQHSDWRVCNPQNLRGCVQCFQHCCL